MYKVKLTNYAGEETIIKIKKQIKSIFYQKMSGDDILHILYNDGEEDYFDSSDGREMNIHDDYCFIPVEEIKEGVLFDIRKHLKK